MKSDEGMNVGVLLSLMAPGVFWFRACLSGKMTLECFWVAREFVLSLAAACGRLVRWLVYEEVQANIQESGTTLVKPQSLSPLKPTRTHQGWVQDSGFTTKLRKRLFWHSGNTPQPLESLEH